MTRCHLIKSEPQYQLRMGWYSRPRVALAEAQATSRLLNEKIEKIKLNICDILCLNWNKPKFNKTSPDK